MRYTIRIAAAALAAGLLSAGLVPARAAKAPAKPAAKPQATQSFTLTKAQQEKLAALSKKARAEAEAVQKGKGTDAEKRTKLMAIAKKYDAQELQVLTPDQRKKVLAVRAQQRQNQERMLAVAKTLTPDQKKKIEGFRVAFEKKLRALDADKKLTAAQKRAKFGQIQAAFEKQIEGALTAKQRAMLKAR